jgi:membrane-associated protease RseP (regulator of RpoE activity)
VEQTSAGRQHSRFAHVILEYGRSVMILQPQPSTMRPFEERKTFGMTIITGSPDLHHFTISAVGIDSAAAAAGFQKGDVITAIDGCTQIKRLPSAFICAICG